MHMEVEVWWYNIRGLPDTVDVNSRLMYKLISELILYDKLLLSSDMLLFDAAY